MTTAEGERRVAVITGGASGLGAATAKLLASRGVRPVIVDIREPASAQGVVDDCEALGVETLALQADVADDPDCVRVAQAVVERFGRIDILVNNAATTKYARHADLHALSAADFLGIYSVNLVGPFQMIRACAPAMKAQGLGVVVNVSSAAGVNGVGSSVAYAASKGALLTMTKSLARALAPEIRVNAVCPGFMATPWFDAHFDEARMEHILRAAAEDAPLETVGSAELVADAVVFLALDGARYITGETLLSDGGLHLTTAGAGRKR